MQKSWVELSMDQKAAIEVFGRAFWTQVQMSPWGKEDVHTITVKEIARAWWKHYKTELGKEAAVELVPFIFERLRGRHKAERDGFINSMAQVMFEQHRIHDWDAVHQKFSEGFDETHHERRARYQEQSVLPILTLPGPSKKKVSLHGETNTIDEYLVMNKMVLASLIDVNLDNIKYNCNKQELVHPEMLIALACQLMAQSVRKQIPIEKLAEQLEWIDKTISGSQRGTWHSALSMGTSALAGWEYQWVKEGRNNRSSKYKEKWDAKWVQKILGCVLDHWEKKAESKKEGLYAQLFDELLTAYTKGEEQLHPASRAVLHLHKKNTNWTAIGALIDDYLVSQWGALDASEIKRIASFDKLCTQEHGEEWTDTLRPRRKELAYLVSAYEPSHAWVKVLAASEQCEWFSALESSWESWSKNSGQLFDVANVSSTMRATGVRTPLSGVWLSELVRAALELKIQSEGHSNETSKVYCPPVRV